MGEIVQMGDYRPHAQGAAKCLDCKHEWQAVAPVGVTWMECPRCALMRGRFVGPHHKSDPVAWVCDCGNNLFQMLPSGLFCQNCGVTQNGWQT